MTSPLRRLGMTRPRALVAGSALVSAGLAAAVLGAMWLPASAWADSSAGPSTTAPGTIVGASQAVCTPSPCRAAAGYTTVTLPRVSNDDGTTSTRQYAVIRPAGLTPSLSNRAPAVLFFYAGGNCGYHGGGRWTQLAVPNRFVVVAMEASCTISNWRKRNINSASPTAPDDEPYISAVVQSLEQCPSVNATAAQCIDPQRVYAVGMSSGGNMVGDIMCDAQNSTLFRGYFIDSSSLQLWNGVPDCPSRNRSFFVMMALSNYGIDAGFYYGTATNPHLDVPGFADWAAARLGCSASRVDGAIGSPVASTLTYTYAAPCAYAVSGTAVQTLGVINGGHTWGCQDSDPGTGSNPCPGMPVPPGLGPNGKPKTNGLFIENVFWTMMAQGVSTATPAPPLPAATVALVAPRQRAAVHGVVTVRGIVDGGVPVAAAQLEVDGVAVGAPVVPAPGGAFAVPWNTLPASNGPHLIDVTVRDTSGHTSSSLPLTVIVGNPLSQAVGARLEALGDDWAAGPGFGPYLAGTNQRGDRCRRSPQSYAYLAAQLLRVPARSFGFHACAGATVSTLLGPTRANHEPAQRHWVGRGSRVVTVSIGWNDSHIAQALTSCALGRSCAAGWGRAISGALAQLSARSGANSLAGVFGLLAHAAPRARLLVVGYPRLFPTAPPRACSVGGRGLRLSGAAMRWLNLQVHRLDGILRTAARRAHAIYVSSENAFAGHELCTAQPYVSGAARIGRSNTLQASSFMPSALGQAALADLLAPVA